MTTNHRPALNETRVRVRYAETDQMGVVYHTNHFVWFEVGRVELMRQMGFAYRDIERNQGCFMAVAEAKCQYRAPVFYDEEVVVRTWLKSVRESVIVFNYELLRPGTDTLLAEGETLHIVIDRNMQLAKLPEKYFKAFRAAVRRKREKAIERSSH
jgi:acyl-CoA thioester hydrolase